MFRWNAEIQEGIYAMLEMLVDLVTTRLEREPVPCGLLATLALVSLHYYSKIFQGAVHEISIP